MTDKYCLRGEIKKLEVEMWNLKVKGTDVVSYNQRFQVLALMCARMFLEESDKIEKYVSGLPDMIHESVKASKLKTMHDGIEFATELMDKKINTFAERSGERKPYEGSKPLCPKCNYHHEGKCAPKGHKCNRVGHLARDYRSPTNANNNNNNNNNQRVPRANPRVFTCFECRGNSRRIALSEQTQMPMLSRAVIVCAEKIVRIPFGNEILIIPGDGIFLAHVTMKKSEDKSEEK
ncbi:hypothetical protein Tco_0557324 [Tanacetum coccineum]